MEENEEDKPVIHNDNGQGNEAHEPNPVTLELMCALAQRQPIDDSRLHDWKMDGAQLWEFRHELQAMAEQNGHENLLAKLRELTGQSMRQSYFEKSLPHITMKILPEKG